MIIVQSAFDLQASLEACHRQGVANCLKISEDLDRYDRVIASTRPDVVVECGTYEGFSAAWFAGRGLDVITIDVEPDVEQREIGALRHDRPVPAQLRDNPKITWLIGSSTGETVVQRVCALVGARRCMVVLDSNHDAEHVRREIEIYGGLVTPGCFLVVEDGILRWLSNSYEGNPLDAIEDLLVNSSEFEWSGDVEAMHPVTLFPGGWWRRR